MVSGTKYRVLSAIGAFVFVVLSLSIANFPLVQWLFTTYVPVVNNLDPTVLVGKELAVAVALTSLVVLPMLSPLYKPQPRRILDTIGLSMRRVFAGGMALATIGYFDYSFRLPRATLFLTTCFMLFLIPSWFVLIRRQPVSGEERAIIIGDDTDQIDTVLRTTDRDIIGFVAPLGNPDPVEQPLAIADGGYEQLTHLGGLSRLDDILVEHDVDTAIFTFRYPDRAEFFGALAECHDHGLTAEVLRGYTDSVLTADNKGELVEIDLEPWDWQERVLKRLFDVCFSLVGLLAFAPVMSVIAIAIKLDSPGPVFYRQERTAEFGETFDVYKFRSMLPDSEDVNPGEAEDRITTVGRFLRRTHLDELPQLWSILKGDMSVVGPRATWVDEELVLEEEVETWRKRWFVKPGLTGLAQVNDVKSTEPSRKLRYDLRYIRKQSLWFDMKIVIRQVWKVVEDIVSDSA